MVCERGDLQLTAREYAIEDCIRETSQINATNATGLDDLPAQRSIFGYLNRALEFRNETTTQTRLLIFVEPDRLQVFDFSFSKEAITHRSRALAFLATSSAGMDGLPSDSDSATRRTDSSPH
jgi:hypothetical protein